MIKRWGPKFNGNIVEPVEMEGGMCYDEDVTALEAENKEMREWSEVYLSKDDNSWVAYLEEREWEYTDAWRNGGTKSPFFLDDAMHAELKAILAKELS